MAIDLLRAELERLFELEEMLTLSRDVLGFDPEAIGGASKSGSFARALTEFCAKHDAVEALCDAMAASKADVRPEVLALRLSGLPPEDEIPLGEHLGPYLVVRKFGEGPSGISYLARTDEMEVRLKVLRREAVRDQRALRRFLALTHLSSRVRQPSLPLRVRSGVASGRHYVAHDAVDGQPLSARVRRAGPMHLNEARTALVQLLEALSALHSERIVHGNLKLENVLVYQTPDGLPRTLLLDTCGDRLRTRPPANGHAEPWAVSSPKTISPECLRGQAPTTASDVYSFGALLFEILTGKPPFDGSTVADALVGHLVGQPPEPSRIAPPGWVSPDVDAFVLSLLSKDPDARPANALAVLEQMQGVGRPTVTDLRSFTITKEELDERIDRLMAAPHDEEAALSVEAAASEGADPARVAEALLLAADLARTGEGETGRAAIGLLFRAGRLYQDSAGDLDAAERAYAKIVALDPGEAVAEAQLDELRKKLGKYEEVVESLLERVERAQPGPERAKVLARIGSLYEQELGDPEQALVAMTQALTEDPASAEHAEAVERLAGNATKAWGEVLATCNASSTENRPVEIKNALFARMAEWYEKRYFRPDLALACHQAILATDPASTVALDGLTGLYRSARQWRELAALLLRRADMTTQPARARDLLCEAAQILATELAEEQQAAQICRGVLAADPAHPGAATVLARLLEKSKSHGELVSLLSSQAEALRGEERARALCRIATVYEDDLGNDEEAVRRYTAVLDDSPDHPEALRALDRLYSKLGRFPELLENLEQQLRVATTPRQKMAIWERIAGVHDEEFLDHEKAAHAMEQVTELDPEHEPSLTALARHYRALSRWEDLVTIHERLLSLPTPPAQKLEVALARARVLRGELSATERAIRAYERVLELDPKHAESLEALARLRETAGHEDAALSAIEALAQEAQTPEARAELLVRAGKLLEARGDRQGAIERLKRALDAKPKDREISKKLRTLYVSHGDGDAAVALLEREVETSDADLEKARLLTELADILWKSLEDPIRAEAVARRALDFDPTNTDSLSITADLCFEAKRYAEAAALYEKLAARTETIAPDVAVRALGRYVDALAKSGSTEKALQSMDTLLRLAPEDPEALFKAASVTFEHGSADRSKELYERLLEQFGSALSDERRAIATYRVGESARRSGALGPAIEALEDAADLDPGSPLPLVALAAAHESRGDWTKVVDAKTRHLDLLHGDERVKLLVEIGEIASEKLGDRPLATKSLVAALDERPDDRKLLTRLLQLYSQDKDWQKLVDVVLKLADFVEDPKQKAKYLQTAGMVTFREMRDYDGALAYYDKALALEPGNATAADESIELCEERGDYAETAERLKKKATLASQAHDRVRMLRAFDALAVIYREKLGRIGHTIDALEAAQTLDPDNADRNRTLAELYASNPHRYLDKAVAAQMAMLRHDPYRAESYKLLRKLYTEAEHADPAWCLCQALYVLKLSDPDEERFFRRMRSDGPAHARATVSPSDWSELIDHPDADPMLTALFATIEPAVLATRGQTFEELGYDSALSVDPSRHPYPIAQMLHYAGGVLGMELPLVFENWNDPGGLGFIPALSAGIVLGTAALDVAASPQSLAFIAGRHLTFYRSGFYIQQLLPTITALRTWLFAAIRMNAPQFPVAPDILGLVREAEGALAQHLPQRHRDQLSGIVSKLIQSGAALDLKRWVQGTEFTADRVGLLLSHDLETAVEVTRASPDTGAAVAPQARLKDLVLYAISNPYFQLRQRLGIAIDS